MKGALTIDKMALLVLAILVIIGVGYLAFSGTSVFEGGIKSFKCEANEIAYCSIGSKWDPACGPTPDCPSPPPTIPTTTPTTTPPTIPPTGLSWLHIEGNLIKNEFGETVYLRGCNKFGSGQRNYYEPWYNISEEDIETMKSLLGLNFVRLPLGLKLLFPTENINAPDSSYLTMIDNVVEWCGERDIYVLLDIHGYDWAMHSPYMWGPEGEGMAEPYRSMVRDFWIFLADRYKENPTVFGVDLFNELYFQNPDRPERPRPLEWKIMVEEWIDAITAVNPNLLFIVENARPDSGLRIHDWSWLKTMPIERPNVIYSPHIYPQGDAKPSWPWAKWPDWFDFPGVNFAKNYRDGNYEQAKMDLEAAMDYLYPSEYPWLMGEFGFWADESGLRCLSDMLDYMNGHGWSYAYWAWCGRGGGLWLLEADWVTLTQQGNIVKEYIRGPDRKVKTALSITNELPIQAVSDALQHEVALGAAFQNIPYENTWLKTIADQTSEKKIYGYITRPKWHPTPVATARWYAEESLEHPEIIGVLLDDLYDQLDKGEWTREIVEEMISIMRTTNPNLEIMVTYYPLYEHDKPFDFDFDSIWLGLGEATLLPNCDEQLNEAYAKFPDKKIWAGIYPGGDWNGPVPTEEQLRAGLIIVRNHYEQGRIAGVAIYDVTYLNDNPDSLAIIQDVLNPPPSPTTTTTSTSTSTTTTTTTIAPTTTTIPFCPSSPPSYPENKWDRIWCDKSFGQKLSDTPDQSNIQFDDNWGTGSVAGIRSNNIGFRSGRRIYFSKTGTYTFTVGSDDGVKVWIDGSLKLDKWFDRAYKTDTFTAYLTTGYHNVRIDFYENLGAARVSFSYTLPTTTTTTIPLTKIFKYSVKEIDLATTSSHSNPYLGVDLSATFTHQGSGKQITVNGFWDGGNNWKIRFAPTITGIWSYSTTSNDNQLNGKTGSFECVEPSPADKAANPNYRGFLKVSSNNRYLTYGDGTPFFWMGGTIWRGNRDSMPYATDFKTYVDNRKIKGFSVIQIFLGNPTNQDSRNENGPLFTSKYDKINPANFQNFDLRLKYILNKGMVPVIFMMWGEGIKEMSLTNLKNYYEYIIARYQAYNVVWCISGEYHYVDDLSKVGNLGNYLHNTDSARHLTTAHPGPSYEGTTTTNDFLGKSWIDVHMEQTWGYDERSLMVSDYNKNDGPVVNGEAGYDGLWQHDRDRVRKEAWTVYMSGGAGYTYGAHGIWNWQENWADVINWPSSTDMKHVVTFFSGTQWWKMKPSDGFVSRGYCLAEKGRQYLVYLPNGGSVEVDLRDASGTLNVEWLNPSTGKKTSGGTTSGGASRYFTPPFGGDAVLFIYK